MLCEKITKIAIVSNVSCNPSIVDLYNIVLDSHCVSVGTTFFDSSRHSLNLEFRCNMGRSVFSIQGINIVNVLLSLLLHNVDIVVNPNIPAKHNQNVSMLPL